MGLNLEIVMILGIFIALATAFFWVCAICITLWNLVTTAFGGIIAVTEPDVSNTLIRKRSRRFSFLSSGSWVGYIVYIASMVLIFLESIFLLLKPSLLSLNNIPLIAVIQIINIGMFIAIGKSLTSAYYKSLLIQYAKISVKKSSQSQEQANIFAEKSNKVSFSIL
jgi:hypothetical protein